MAMLSSIKSIMQYTRHYTTISVIMKKKIKILQNAEFYVHSKKQTHSSKTLGTVCQASPRVCVGALDCLRETVSLLISSNFSIFSRPRHSFLTLH